MDEIYSKIKDQFKDRLKDTVTKLEKSNKTEQLQAFLDGLEVSDEDDLIQIDENIDNFDKIQKRPKTKILPKHGQRQIERQSQ